MAATVVGPVEWSLQRDDAGHRTYKITHLVKSLTTDGPNQALNAVGLPLPGSLWSFGTDSDPWAFCLPTTSVKQVVLNEPGKYWKVEQTFSTKPPAGLEAQRCQDVEIEDPLQEPDRISGSFAKYTQEATIDRFGLAIRNSSHEPFRGPQVEFDRNRPNVRVEQNVTNLQLPLLAQFMDRVNDADLWDVGGSRRIKLSNISWQKKFHATCFAYYTRTLDFDIDFDTFDRSVLDEGTKVLHGHWEDTGWELDNIDGAPPDPNNPQHFDQFKDRNGENAHVVLDGAGKPLSTGATPVNKTIQKYKEADFLLLGIPTLL